MQALPKLLLCLVAFVANYDLARATLPPIESQTLKGKEFRLEDHKGKVVLIDFWATWCPPCRTSLAHYAELHHKYQDRGLIVVAITSEENKASIERFVAEQALPFPIIHDLEGTITAEFNPPTMPTAYLVNQEGKMVQTFAGFNPGDGETIESTIVELLGGKQVPKPTEEIHLERTEAVVQAQGTYRYWSFGLWSTGAVLLGASGYLYMGPLQSSIESRDSNYQLWQNSGPSPEFEGFERAFMDAESRAEKQESWVWLLAGAGLTTVVAGMVTWFSQPINASSEVISDASGLHFDLVPRLNSYRPGFDIFLTW